MAPPSPGSDAGAPDAARALAGLREQGAHRFDAVRFHFIETLARRAAAQQGAVRQVLDDKLAQALDAYIERYEAARCEAGSVPPGPAASPARPLAELVRQHARPTPADLTDLAYFRSTWSKLNLDRQLTRSLARLPKNAGPLNSHRLVLRSLELMREVSPAYLNRFMGYVDALLRLDQLNNARPAPARRQPTSPPA